jgi:hypothetical protein
VQIFCVLLEAARGPHVLHALGFELFFEGEKWQKG